MIKKNFLFKIKIPCIKFFKKGIFQSFTKMKLFLCSFLALSSQYSIRALWSIIRYSFLDSFPPLFLSFLDSLFLMIFTIIIITINLNSILSKRFRLSFSIIASGISIGCLTLINIESIDYIPLLIVIIIMTSFFHSCAITFLITKFSIWLFIHKRNSAFYFAAWLISANIGIIIPYCLDIFIEKQTIKILIIAGFNILIGILCIFQLKTDDNLNNSNSNNSNQSKEHCSLIFGQSPLSSNTAKLNESSSLKEYSEISISLISEYKNHEDKNNKNLFLVFLIFKISFCIALIKTLQFLLTFRFFGFLQVYHKENHNQLVLICFESGQVLVCLLLGVMDSNKKLSKILFIYPLTCLFLSVLLIFLISIEISLYLILVSGFLIGFFVGFAFLAASFSITQCLLIEEILENDPNKIRKTALISDLVATFLSGFLIWISGLFEKQLLRYFLALSVILMIFWGWIVIMFYCNNNVKKKERDSKDNKKFENLKF